MREIRTSGSVRGASGNGRPYRERSAEARFGPSCFWFCPRLWKNTSFDVKDAACFPAVTVEKPAGLSVRAV